MQAIETDEFYMQRCLQLAKLGWGNVSPNPLVGAVIVHKGKVIGEGYHRVYGEAHAEVNAINQVSDLALLKESTIYVNLEPCSHVGKTPACSDLIVRMGIPNVVVGMQDPFDQVSGRGIARLKNAGINVTVGILEKECIELNRVFIEFHTKKKPWIRIKFAQSADGFIDRFTENKHQAVAITNSFFNTLNHKERAGIDAIAVGYQTALRDNPSLSPRLWSGKMPTRIVFDRYNSLPRELNLFKDGNETWVVTERSVKSEPHVTFIETNWEQRIETVLHRLYQANKAFLLVEGGSSLIQTFIESETVNELWKFTNKQLMISDGTKSPTIALTPIETITFEHQELKRYSAQ